MIGSISFLYIHNTFRFGIKSKHVIPSEVRNDTDFIHRIPKSFLYILEGTMKGKLEEKIEIAKQAKSMGLPMKDIVTLTGLSEADIAAL
jgi:hypothetical protein